MTPRPRWPILIKRSQPRKIAPRWGIDSLFWRVVILHFRTYWTRRVMVAHFGGYLVQAFHKENMVTWQRPSHRKVPTPHNTTRAPRRSLWKEPHAHSTPMNIRQVAWPTRFNFRRLRSISVNEVNTGVDTAQWMIGVGSFPGRTLNGKR